MVFLWKMIASFRHLKICNHTFTWDIQYRSKVSWQSRLEVLSFKTLKEFFEDLKQRFWGNNLILENKTIAMNKTIDTWLCSRKPALNVCKYSFMLCIFYKAHAALKLITPKQQTNIPAMCICSFTCQSEWVFFLCVLRNPPDIQEF